MVIVTTLGSRIQRSMGRGSKNGERPLQYLYLVYKVDSVHMYHELHYHSMKLRLSSHVQFQGSTGVEEADGKEGTVTLSKITVVKHPVCLSHRLDRHISLFTPCGERERERLWKNWNSSTLLGTYSSHRSLKALVNVADGPKRPDSAVNLHFQCVNANIQTS